MLLAGLDVTPTSGLVTSDIGGTAKFTVCLETKPGSNVTVPIQSNNTSEGQVSPASLTFTTSNWAVPQVVTVTGVVQTNTKNVNYKIIIGSPISNDSSYSRLKSTNISVTDVNADVTAMANLKSFNPNVSTTVDLLGYYASGDGGGGTFVWTPGDTAPGNGGTVIASSVAGAPAGRWVRQYSGAIDAAWFGATGNGTTDDTKALQAALNAAAGGGTLDLVAGHTYLVSFAGNKTVVQANGPFYQRYCLQIGSGTTFDLEGATLRLANGQDASILINQDPNFGVAGDSDITVEDGIFDGNRTHQTYPASGTMACLFLSNCTDVTNTDLTFNNVRDLAMYWQKVGDSYANNLLCTYSDGDGFFFGFYAPSTGFDGRVYNSHIGRVEADNCHNNTYIVGTFIRQGNPVLMNAVNCTFDLMTATDCGGGFKVSDGSYNDTIGEADFYGTPAAQANSTNATNNSGFKIQGQGVGYDPHNITVDKVVSQACYGAGLYIENADNNTVVSYTGTGNGRSGVDPDVWLGTGSGNQLESVSVSSSGGEGVVVRSGANDYEIGQITINEACKVTSGEAGVDIQGLSGTINSVSVSDPTGRTRYGVAVFSSTSRLTIGQATVAGPIATPVRNQSPFTSIKLTMQLSSA